MKDRVERVARCFLAATGPVDGSALGVKVIDLAITSACRLVERMDMWDTFARVDSGAEDPSASTLRTTVEGGEAAALSRQTAALPGATLPPPPAAGAPGGG